MEKYIPSTVSCILFPGTNRIDGNENEKANLKSFFTLAVVVGVRCRSVGQLKIGICET